MQIHRYYRTWLVCSSLAGLLVLTAAVSSCGSSGKGGGSSGASAGGSANGGSAGSGATDAGGGSGGTPAGGGAGGMPAAGGAAGASGAGGAGGSAGAGGAAGAAGSGGVSPDGPAGPWKLVFDDEFDGTSLDLTKWSSSWFNGGSMNNVTTSPANVSVAGGILSLKLSSSTVGACVTTNPNGGAQTGFQFTYGYAEARVLFPGSGSTIDNWPAWWTDGQSWPGDGEIDIAEGLGKLTTNYHNASGAFNSGPISGQWGGTWHVYGADWEAGTITIYWDGKVVHTLTSAKTSITSSPQYLILNNGAGHTADIGASLQVDYVRVWQHP